MKRGVYHTTSITTSISKPYSRPFFPRTRFGDRWTGQSGRESFLTTIMLFIFVMYRHTKESAAGYVQKAPWVARHPQFLKQLVQRMLRPVHSHTQTLFTSYTAPSKLRHNPIVPSAQWWAPVSPLYPTNFILPIISPTVKKPNTSAKITPPVIIWLVLMFRNCSSMPEGVAALEVDAEVNADRGFPDRMLLTNLWKYDWNVAIGLAAILLAFRSCKSSQIMLYLRRVHLLSLENQLGKL
jgi:hypothetical protein